MGLSKKILVNEISHVRLLSYIQHRFNGIYITSSPVFIVGCGHSGTTMLRHIMGMHHNLYAVPYESRVFFHPAIKIYIADAIWSFTAISKGKTRWIEKTPSHIHHLDRIFQIYPDSKIIILIRDGRDVAISLNNRWNNFERAVWRWIYDNQAGEVFWDHPQVKKIKYEELIYDFEKSVKILLDFIGEHFDKKLLSFCAHHSNINNIHSVIKNTKPKDIRTKQIEAGLYNQTGKWKYLMSEKQKSIFKEVAGDMLIKYGYAKDNTW